MQLSWPLPKLIEFPVIQPLAIVLAVQFFQVTPGTPGAIAIKSDGRFAGDQAKRIAGHTVQRLHAATQHHRQFTKTRHIVTLGLGLGRAQPPNNIQPKDTHQCPRHPTPPTALYTGGLHRFVDFRFFLLRLIAHASFRLRMNPIKCPRNCQSMPTDTTRQPI